MTKSEQTVSKMKKGHEWFNNARFGMFIHWGLYAIWGRGEWVMNRENIPGEKYCLLADQFNPTKFDADSWAKLAKDAGANYMVLTTRHHDGFCLYDSKVSDFTSVKTRAGRDFVGEYVKACRKAGLKVGLYYSLVDWQFPAFYGGPKGDRHEIKRMVDQAHDQVRELLSNYGKIDLLWYDGGPIPGLDVSEIARFWRSRELNAMARRLQPHILINNRSGLPEDFSTPEQHVTPPGKGRLWEACMTIGSGWGYIKGDKEFKSVKCLLSNLIKTARYGGNLLLNVGPRADGTIQPEFKKRLIGMGRWLAENGKAIYGSERTSITEAEHVSGPVTQKGNTLYYHFQEWPGNKIRIAGLPGKIHSVNLLGSKDQFNVEPGQYGSALISGFPRSECGKNGISVLEVRCKPGTGRVKVPRLLVEESSGRNDVEPAPLIKPEPTGKIDMAHKNGRDLCPGWREYRIIYGESGITEFKIDIPANGLFTLEVGLIAEKPGRIDIDISGKKIPGIKQLYIGGYPDTVKSLPIVLNQGKKKLRIQNRAKSPIGVYGLRLQPILRTLPSELWTTIGPFPTIWSHKSRGDEIRRAMKTVFPPELEIDLNASYRGLDGLVSWQGSSVRRGENANRGVNFGFRCKAKDKGVCYAVTSIYSPGKRNVQLFIGCDWWANAWLNGKRLKSERDVKLYKEDGAWFNTWKPVMTLLPLRKGDNRLLVKCHRGGNSNWFTCFINDPGDLNIRGLI